MLYPGLERMKPGVEQREPERDAGHGWPPSPSAETLEALAAELSDLLWRRQESVLEWLPSAAWRRSSAQNSALWREHLLAEIEDLAGELNKKVARYASIRAAHTSGGAAETADAAAMTWVHQTLEDIAAAALGMEIASREAFLRAKMAQEQHLEAEAAQEQTIRAAE